MHDYADLRKQVLGRRRHAILTRKPTSGEPGQVSLAKRIFSLPTIISFLLAVALIIFLVARFDINLAGTWEKIKGSNPLLYLAALAIYYLSFFPVRGLRWRLLLANVGQPEDGKKQVPSALICGELVLLAWFANAITWFRLGDAYRAYLLNQRTGASVSRTLGTVLAERILDMASVLALLALGAVLMWRISASKAESVLAVALVFMVLGVAGLITMRLFGARLAHRLPQRLQAIYGRFQQGTFSSFRRNVPTVVLLSIGGWALEVMRLLLVVQALGLSVNLPLALFVALTHAVITTLPVTPGGLGLAETGMTGLLALSLPTEAAVSVALLDRSITYLSVVVIGAAVFFLREVRKVGIRPRVPESQHNGVDSRHEQGRA